MKVQIDVTNKSIQRLVTSKGAIKLVNGKGIIEFNDDTEQEVIDKFIKELSVVGVASVITEEAAAKMPTEDEAKNSQESSSDGVGLAGSQLSLLQGIAAQGKPNNLPPVA